MLRDGSGEAVCPVCGHRTYPEAPKVETMDISPPRRNSRTWVKGQRPGAELLNQCEAPRNQGGRCMHHVRPPNRRCGSHPLSEGEAKVSPDGSRRGGYTRGHYEVTVLPGSPEKRADIEGGIARGRSGS